MQQISFEKYFFMVKTYLEIVLSTSMLIND